MKERIKIYQDKLDIIEKYEKEATDISDALKSYIISEHSVSMTAY